MQQQSAVHWTRSGRTACLVLAGALVCTTAATATAGRLRIRSDFSPENSRRSLRPETRYIVLHTTEAREAGSLRKLRKRGEAHYFVHSDGRVTRLLDRRRIATHAGRSMWNGRTRLDEVSLGIEVFGYHNKELTAAQYKAIAELLRQLQSLYDIPDERVLTHSMVAYGAPNRFHPYRHRGRKRCAMVLARTGARRRLGLTAAPRRDPDVAAGRLRIGDPELQRILYPAPRPRTTPPSAPPAPTRRAAAAPTPNTITRKRTAWSIAGRAYASSTTVYVLPDGTRIRGHRMDDWSELLLGTRVLLDQPAEPRPAVADVNGLLLVGAPAAARDLLGPSAAAGTTSYLFPSGAVRTGAGLAADARGRGLLARLPKDTRILVGYVNAGKVTASRSLTQIAGNRWNDPSTYYRVPSGGIRTGAEIQARRVPRGTLVFFRQ